MNDTVTPWPIRHLAEYPWDPTQGPCTWLVRGWNATAVTWPGFVSVDLWDLNACQCPCHLQSPAMGHGRREPQPPTPRPGPEAWPAPRDPLPPPPRPVPDGQQLDIYAALDTARSTP